MTHWRTKRNLERMARGALSPWRQRRVLQHAAACAGCRAHYEALLEIEAHLQGVGHELTGGQIERIAQRCISEPPKRSTSFDLLGLSRRRASGLVLAATAISVFAVFLYGVELRDEFQARGILPGPEADIRLRIYCLAKGEPSSLRGFYPVPQFSWRSLRNRCSIEDVLGFAYDAGASAPPFLFVMGVDEELRPLWYHPIPRERRSIAVRNDGERVDLPGVVELSKNHRPGRLNIVTFASYQALTVEQVETALSGLRAENDQIDTLASRLGVQVEQRIFSIQLEGPQ